MHQGSCLCGMVKYEISNEIKSVVNCHCKMCQKQHGAAFVSYGSVPRDKFRYVSGSDKLTTYNSSKNITRKFCSRCGSNMEWSGSEEYPDWVSFTVATLDTELKPEKIKNIHTESQACWIANS